MTTPLTTAGILDSVARVAADAVHGHIFAAGVTSVVTAAQPLVVPIATDFAEAGLPAVTVALGPWTSLDQSGSSERLHFDLLCAVWRELTPLDINLAALYGDRDALADAFIAHAKAYLAEVALQSVLFAEGTGIVARALHGDPYSPPTHLTLPFTVRVVTNRVIDRQAA
jgi:hypothetical protein